MTAIKGKSMKSMMMAGMLALLTVIVAACGSGNTSLQESANPGTSSTPVASSPSPSPENTVSPSGKVVVYTAGPAKLAENILAGFEAKTGLTVEQFQGTTGKVMARLEAEKSNPVADVVIVASWPSGMSMKEEGWTQAYPEANGADKLQPEWLDKDAHLFGYSASALGITYNTDLVDTPPTDWSDLTDAKWNNLVNIPDPSLSGSALDFIGGYLSDKGDAGWSLFEDLKKNGVTMAGANQEALDPVVTGSKAVVMAAVDYMAYSAKAKGEPIDIVYPASGTVINPRPAMILKDAPNLDNAKLFIDYLLSDEAQQLVAKAYLLPGITTVPALNRTQTSEIPLLKYEWSQMMEQGDAVTTKFMELYK